MQRRPTPADVPYDICAKAHAMKQLCSKVQAIGPHQKDDAAYRLK